MVDRLDSILAELRAIDHAGLRRRMRPIRGAQTSEIEVDGQRAINFSSNNYLGLADHPALIVAAREAMDLAGFGAGASRLIAGSLEGHRALEARIAEWKGTEAALLFNSGYQANVGLVTALAGPEDTIFSDELNHASLIDGCRLSRARVVIYRHADPSDLRQKLRGESGRRRRLILSDSVFSMDGDRAPLSELAIVAQEFEALLIVDEAHAVGVLGTEGVGLCSGLSVDLQMGTFSKALGGFGAYVAGRRPIIDLLANRARSFVFTTALPVPVVAAAHAAIDWLSTPEAAARITQLTHNIIYFHERQKPLGLGQGLPSHIVPLAVRGGKAATAMDTCEALLHQGIFAQGIRPPTVPGGHSRIRFALMATHTTGHLDRALAAISELRAHFT